MKRILHLFSLLALCCCASSAWSQIQKQEILTFSTSSGLKELGLTVPTSENKTQFVGTNTYTQGDISLSATDGSSTTTRTSIYYLGSNSFCMKVYKGGSITVSVSSGMTLNSITFGIYDIKGNGCFKASSGNFENSGTWTSSSSPKWSASKSVNTVTFSTAQSQNSNTNPQVQLKSITVNYTVPETSTEEDGIKFTFEPTSITTGTLTDAPVGTEASFTNTYKGSTSQLYDSNEKKEGVQVPQGDSITLILTNLPVGYKIDSIYLSVHNNEDEGSGKVTASLGSTTFSGTFYVSGYGNKEWTTAPVTLKSNPTISSTRDVLTIKIVGEQNSAYCDKFIIKLVPTDTAPITKLLSSTATNWGTVCLPYSAQTVTGTTLYTVAGSSDDGILVEPKEDGILVAGTPYIFKAEGEGSFYKASNDSVSEAVAGANNLVGILADKTLTGSAVDGIYILAKSDGIWHCMDKGATVNFMAHRAYLSALPDKVSSTAKPRLSIIGADGLSAIFGVDSDLHASAPKAIYTLAGQRVSSMKKGGIYIVDGKKVFVK